MTYVVNPLTVAEKQWVTKLERVLNSCPSDRLELVTIGDAGLTVIDGKLVRKHDVDLHDGGAERNGVAVGYVFGTVMVHGVSG